MGKKTLGILLLCAGGLWLLTAGLVAAFGRVGRDATVLMLVVILGLLGWAFVGAGLRLVRRPTGENSGPGDRPGSWS